jgi:hypothetical protein
MPTNILRRRGTAISARSQKGAAQGADPQRRVLIKAGRVSIRADLLDTDTANRIWAALPLYSAAETWGSCIHFEIPVESGRERNARSKSELGDICFWNEEDRIIIVFGRTPISQPGEMRLPRPCNLWAKTLDDVTLLKTVVPGEKVSVTAV